MSSQQPYHAPEPSFIAQSIMKRYSTASLPASVLKSDAFKSAVAAARASSTRPVDALTSPSDVPSAFKLMSENVKRLQFQLRSTKTAMEKLSERALKLREDQSNVQPGQSSVAAPRSISSPVSAPAAVPTTATAMSVAVEAQQDSALFVQTQIDTVAQQEKIDVAKAATVDQQVQTTPVVSNVAEEASNPANAPSSIEEEFARQNPADRNFLLQQLRPIVDLEEQNVQLRQRVADVESALNMVAFRAMQRTEELKSQMAEQRQVFDSLLQQERNSNDELRRENELLREKMRAMVKIMTDAADQRERELTENETYAIQLFKENQNLRKMMAMASETSLVQTPQ